MTGSVPDSQTFALGPPGGATRRAGGASAHLSWVLLVLPAVLRGQDPVPPAEELDLPAVLQELRRPSLDPVRRDELVSDLMASGANGAGHVLRIAQWRFGKLHRDFEIDRQEHLKAFAAAAPRLLAERRGPGGMHEVEALRDKVLAHSRGAGPRSAPDPDQTASCTGAK